MDKEKTKKGEIDVNAYAVKPQHPFIAKNKLQRTPASDNTRQMVEFMDSHNFSFSLDKNTNELKCSITSR